MKKKITMVFQSDKPETNDAELIISRNVNQKMYRDHRVCDHHTHGRSNKFPFGSSHGPLFF